MAIILKPTITISNKAIYTFIAIAVLLTISGIVYAYTIDSSGNPEVMGHSADEVERVGKTVYPIKPISIFSRSEEQSTASNENTIENYDFSSAPAGATHAILKGYININYKDGAANCILHAKDHSGTLIMLNQNEGSSVSTFTAEGMTYGMAYIEIPNSKIMELRFSCYESGSTQFGAKIFLNGYLIDESLA